MADILNLLLERDRIALEMAQVVLKIVEEPLTKALQYFMKDARPVTWTAIELVCDHKFVYIYGETVVVVGERINYDGEIITVDEKYVKNHPVNDIRMLIPISVLERGNAEELLEHMKFFWEASRLMSPPEIIGLINSTKIETLRDILQNTTILDRVTRPKQFEGFNVERLTDFQISQIRCFLEDGSKEIH